MKMADLDERLKKLKLEEATLEKRIKHLEDWLKNTKILTEKLDRLITKIEKNELTDKRRTRWSAKYWFE